VEGKIRLLFIYHVGEEKKNKTSLGGWFVGIGAVAVTVTG
jgi:hypothetical protein